MQEAKEARELIDRFGGTGAVARRFGVTSQAVSQWKRAGIPRPWRLLFGYLEAQSSAADATSEDRPLTDVARPLALPAQAAEKAAA